MKVIDHIYLASLVIRSQHDDSDAFAELYALTYNKVYNYACHYLKDTYLAQDAIQEVYISVLKNIHKIQDPTLFTAWLNQICFHICYDMAEKRNDACNIPGDDILELVCDTKLVHNPEDFTFHKDFNERLSTAIKSLPLNERQVIVMRYYNNLKIDEIANALDISRSSVKRYLASGQTKLKQILAF